MKNVNLLINKRLLVPVVFILFVVGLSSNTEAETCTYYVSSSTGNDYADGLTEATAWETISRVNQQSLFPGESVCFKGGDTWRFPTDAYLNPQSGSSAGYVTYTAYGTRAKPLFLGSVKKSSASDWTLTSTPNVWTTPDNSFSYAVGNLIFNFEEATGKMEFDAANLDTQGDYYYDTSRKRILLYSISNPATYYLDIECALHKHMISVASRSYVKLNNLDLRYGGSHGIWGSDSSYIIVSDNDLSYIGGALQSDTTRYGNAIEFWDNANNIYVERNWIWGIFDAALTTQGGGTNTKYNHYFRNNVIWNAGYCFEYFNGPTTSSTYNIYVENNTCAYSGYGWGSVPQGRPSYGSHIMSWGNDASISNFYIRNNIFYEAMDRGFKLAGGWTEAALANLFLNNNLWYDSSDYPVNPYTPPWQYMIWYCRSYAVPPTCNGYSMATFSQYQADTGKDINSIAADPLFNNVLNNDFSPIIGSPACTMSSTAIPT